MLFLLRVWFSSWYFVSIDTGHPAQSPQSGPRWSPTFKMEPVLSVSSFPPSMGFSQARILEWISLSSSRASSHPRVRTPVSCISCMTVFVVTFSLISSKHIADILLKAIHSRLYLGNILYTTYLLCKTHK